MLQVTGTKIFHEVPLFTILYLSDVSDLKNVKKKKEIIYKKKLYFLSAYQKEFFIDYNNGTKRMSYQEGEGMKNKMWMDPYNNKKDVKKEDKKMVHTEFVVNHTNKLAYQAAQYLGRRGGLPIFYPCWIIGETGCGKTHLATMVADTAKANGKEVRMISVEKFVANVVEVIKECPNIKTKDIAKKVVLEKDYDVDVLILEDLDVCWHGKDATQSLLADVLAGFGRKFGTPQVLLTSQKFDKGFYGYLKKACPKAMAVRILKQDYELKKKILKRNFQKEGVVSEEGVVEVLAAHAKNGAQMRGILEQIKLYRDLGEMITKDAVIDILKRKGYWG